MCGWSERDLALIGAPDEIIVVKYGRHSSGNVTPMTSDSAAETTLQLEPTG
jgi:hypothetical protein